MTKFKFETIVLVIVLCLMIPKPHYGQTNNQDSKISITNFIESLCNDKITYDELINNFLNTDVGKTEFLINHLKLAREELRGRKIKMEKIVIVNYEEGIKNEKMSPIEIAEEKKSNAYFVVYDGELLMPVLVEKNRILSFSTMNKGGRRYFMENN